MEMTQSRFGRLLQETVDLLDKNQVVQGEQDGEASYGVEYGESVCE